MTHANAPLSREGRRRLIERCKTRPIAHVAAEMGISRACASKWVNRWRTHGEIGLLDRSATPRYQPTATSADIVNRIETMRREHKWPASRIAFELAEAGVSISRRTVSRLLVQLGLNRRRFIDPVGDSGADVVVGDVSWSGDCQGGNAVGACELPLQSARPNSSARVLDHVRPIRRRRFESSVSRSARARPRARSSVA